MVNESASQAIVSVNPFRCRMWSLHDRLEEQITEGSCRVEVASVQKHGQLVPALGRRLRGDPAYEVELIYGARRLFVARHLNVPLKVELRDITDREAVVAMDIENRQRQDISPYERGVSYARWLRQGVFQSQDELAGALRVSAAHVSRLLKIARLPPIILSAFQDVRQLCEAWAMEIAVALEDPVKRDSILRVARELTRTMPPPSAREVSRRLLAAPAKGRKPIAKRTDQVIFDEEGRPLFRVRHERTTIALLLPPDRISATTLKEVCSTLKTVLQRDLGLGLDGPQRIAAAPEASGRVAALPVCVPISSKGR